MAVETRSEHETDLTSRNSSHSLIEDKAKPFGYSWIKVFLIQVMGKMSSGAVSLMYLWILLRLKHDGNFQVVYGGKFVVGDNERK